MYTFRCFEYSILAALHHQEMERQYYEKPAAYKRWIGTELNFGTLSTPMPVYEINKFEKLNGLSINVYYYHTKNIANQNVSPLYISKERNGLMPINLLVLDNGVKYHYTFIRNFSNLFTRKKSNHVKYCPYCLQHFWDKAKCESHILVCKTYDPVGIKIPDGDKKWIKFKKVEAMEPQPVVIYADFETLNIPLEDEEENETKTKKCTKQDVCGYSYVIVSPYFENRLFTYRGENAASHFLQSIIQEEKKIEKFFYKNHKPMNELTLQELYDFSNATHCYICKDTFNEEPPTNDIYISHILKLSKEVSLQSERIPSQGEIKRKIKQIQRRMKSQTNELINEYNNEMLSKLYEIQDYLKLKTGKWKSQDSLHLDTSRNDIKNLEKGYKVKDHCHWSGNYRGPAHNLCNLKMRKFRKIPCFFHNFAGYDAHLLVRGFNSNLIEKSPKIIPKSLEKYIYLSLEKIEFKDSFQFLNTSLERLVSNLKTKGGNITTQFPNTWTYFKRRWKHLDPEAFDMLTEKLSYPYSYFQSFENFNEETLPDIKYFHNDITNENIDPHDYEKVKKIWNTFEMNTLGDLHNLYVETDVLLLADCFEKFRQFALLNYKLDPAHFISAPSLSWESALLKTKVNLEIPQDIDMHLFIDRFNLKC